jgi:hypothetical protein
VAERRDARNSAGSDHHVTSIVAIGDDAEPDSGRAFRRGVRIRCNALTARIGRDVGQRTNRRSDEHDLDVAGGDTRDGATSQPADRQDPPNGATPLT